jgi:UPF0271 protein
VIDLNADVGESFGAWHLGDDARLMQFITSANVACGFHAGDPATLRTTIRLAVEHGVAAGAHPGYNDLPGFGRRAIEMSARDIEDMVLYQLGATFAFAHAAGVDLDHVKPHGALYNRAAEDMATAAAIARAVAAFDDGLILVGLAGSALIDAGRQEGLLVAREAFADRVYEPHGMLRSRSLPGAVLTETADVVRQALAIATVGRVRSVDGVQVEVIADTICLHGDTPGAVEHAHAVRIALEQAGVEVTRLRRVLGCLR